MLIYIRPVVIVCVYVELAVSMVWWAARGIVTWDGSSFRNCYESFRNAVSLRTLGRMVFGSKVPHGEERLSRQRQFFFSCFIGLYFLFSHFFFSTSRYNFLCGKRKCSVEAFFFFISTWSLTIEVCWTGSRYCFLPFPATHYSVSRRFIN